jgi:chemotaxis protein methyltransferase CheR
MFSSDTERGAQVTLDALALGASDYAPKPAVSTGISEGLQRVREAAHGDPLEPGVISIAPGNFHMTVQRLGPTPTIAINQDPPENSCRPAVDVLFRSAAQLYGSHVLGVILTGMGQDGLRGCEDLAERGGRIFVQDEASSVVWGMPGFVARAGRRRRSFRWMPWRWKSCGRSIRAVRPARLRGGTHVAITQAEFDFIRTLVSARAGIVLESGKEYLVEARLAPVTTRLGLPSIGDLVSRVRGEPRGGLASHVVEAMTTNETTFFRDSRPFEALRTQMLPGLIQARRTCTQLRIWCAASSTGQEPYSLAMLLAEHFPELASWEVQIIASDLSVDVLDRAKAARYTQFEVNRGLPIQYLMKYFQKQGTEWQLKRSIADRVEFKQINLIEHWPVFPPLDMVFIRNVMIYFDVETKKQILQRIRHVLRPDGSLFLGAAETTMNLGNEFTRTEHDLAGIYRVAA